MARLDPATLRHLARTCLALPCLLLSCTTGTLPAGPFEVQVEDGTRRTTNGDRIAYSLFVPRESPGLPRPPWPAVVLMHGFARDHRYARNNALYMAQRGIVVLTPDMVNLLAGEPAQLRNISNAVDHVTWLVSRNADSQDSLAGKIDVQRIGLAGHSAGGAVSLEAAIDLQNTPTPAAALALLDAVPWERTLARTADLDEIPMASVRSEPSPCNAGGVALNLLDRLTFSVQDVRVVDGTHCDPENPSDWLCTITCGGARQERQVVYQRLMYLFFQDAFGMPSPEDLPETYVAALEKLAAQGRVAVSNSAAATHAQPVAPGQDSL